MEYGPYRICFFIFVPQSVFSVRFQLIHCCTDGVPTQLSLSEAFVQFVNLCTESVAISFQLTSNSVEILKVIAQLFVLALGVMTSL